MRPAAVINGPAHIAISKTEKVNWASNYMISPHQQTSAQRSIPCTAYQRTAWHGIAVATSCTDDATSAVGRLISILRKN